MLVCFSKQPYWRFKIASNFIDWVEKKKHEDCGIQITGIKNHPKRGPASRTRSRHHPPTVNEKAVVPAGLPSDWYAKEFLLFLTPAKREALRLKAPVFEGASNCTVDFAPYLLIEESQQIYDKNLENNDGEDEIAWLNDTDKGKGKNKGGITNKDEDLLMEEANSLFDGLNDEDEEEEL
ncbi:hypothetical protein BY996DRAFT_6418664 [Phakopsora pachyrhizi]|nr:hypothetical protein BY996DRAFT_6418664 [Phakopsora pachyrhizi]